MPPYDPKFWPSYLITYLTLDAARIKKGENNEDLQHQCHSWINLCAFLARCIKVGLLKPCGEGCWYPLCDIPKGLQADHPVEAIRKCYLTVAAQYVLLAGTKIYRELVAEQLGGAGEIQAGLDKWLHWKERLKQVADDEGTGSELGGMALKAHKKMGSIRYDRYHCSRPVGDYITHW